MDIYCTRCGEAWDMDCLHDEIDLRGKQGLLKVPAAPASYDWGDPGYQRYREAYEKCYATVREDFLTRGCVALTTYGMAQCEKRESNTTAAMSAMAELMGDDLDGVAAMMDDFAAMGML